MLEPVAAQRSGAAFRVPGLFQDARGIVVSHEAGILLHSQDQLLALLRIVSEDTTLAELLGSLRVEELRSAIGGQGFFVRVRLADSRGLDRFARAAAFCGGQLSVGSGRHFVRYRDAQGPYGYDALSLHGGSDGDYVVYTPHAAQIFQRVGERIVSRLITQMRLLPRGGGLTAALRQHDPREPLWLLVPSTLLHRVLRYLWLRAIDAAAALPEPTQAAASSHCLLRLPGDIARAPAALLGLPGLRWLLPLCEHIAVELGHSHPLNLLPFAALFSDSQRHLFLADAPAPLVLPGGSFVEARHLVKLTEVEPASAAAASPDAIASGRVAASLPSDLSQLARVKLALLPEATAAGSPAAARVPWSRLDTLAQLTFRLPPAALANLQAVATDAGLLIRGDVSHLPLGDLFYEAAPQVLVPLGWTVVPRLSATALRAQLVSTSADGWLLLSPGPAPAASLSAPAAGPRRTVVAQELPAGAWVALSRLLLARLAAEVPTLEPPPSEPDPPQAVYPALGWLWPLWGGPRPRLPEPPALPAAASPASRDASEPESRS